MSRENPLFTEKDSPADALYRVAYILSFLGQIQADGEGDIILNSTGRTGMYFFLNILEGTVHQVAEELNK